MAEEKMPQPDWLNKDYVEKALRQAFDAPELEIKHFVIQLATAAGDNYASKMFRVTCQLQKTAADDIEHLSILLKVTHKSDDDDLTNFWKSVWDREATVMIDILPQLNDIIEQQYPDREPFAAKCLWHGTEPMSVIMIQDLKELGFQNADRMEGLDAQMTYKVLECLALFHASSLVLQQNDQNAIPQHWYNFQCCDRMLPIIKSSCHSLIEEVQSWHELDQTTIEKLKCLEETFEEKIVALLSRDPTNLTVLTHGDCWINNFMFSKQEDDLRFRFVDFQGGYLDSPAMDLNYFLFSSPRGDLRISCLEQFLEFYYTTFMEAVERLNIVLPIEFTFEDFLGDFKKRLIYGLFALIVVFPITVLTPDEAPDVAELIGSSIDRHFLYRGQKFKEIFTKCLPYFLENDII